MSLIDDIKEQFGNGFRLKAPDTSTSHPWHLTHLHADFFELQALFWFKNSWLTCVDLVGVYKDNGENTDVEHSGSNEVGSDAADKEDKLQSKIAGLFMVCEEREDQLGDYYPFELNRSSKTIRLKVNENLSDSNHLYLMLLLCSNLNCLPKLGARLTKDFEKVSAFALESYLPTAVVREFGKNTAYSGNTISKIRAISEELFVSVRENEIAKLAATASQEKGVDLLAYVPFGDQNANRFILLAQCACGKGWSKKTNETSNYEAYLDFYRLRPVHSMFVPYSLISVDGQLTQSDSLVDRLLFERSRIVTGFQKYEEFKQLKSHTVVVESINTVAAEV